MTKLPAAAPLFHHLVEPLELFMLKIKYFFFLSEIVHLVEAGSFVCLENSEVRPLFILGSIPFHPTI